MARRQSNPSSDGFPSDLLADLRPAGARGLRERLEHGLRSAIQERRLVPGAPLPATRVLAAELGISRSVVVEAYGNLAADGYLEARRGAGTRVRGEGRRPPPHRDRRRYDDPAVFFAGARRPASRHGPPIRLIGGLPDPALFPRALWARHYRSALMALPDAELTYPDIRGARALRTALTAYLGRVRGVATTPDRLLVCAGFTQALTLISRALRHGGARRVALEDPCFGIHRESIAGAGLEPVPVPVDERGIEVARLAAHDVDAVLVAPAHSYPLGAVLDARRRRELIAWARRREALVIEDDYDAEFRYDRTPVGALHGLAPDRVAYVGCASKILSPSLRLAWIAAPAGLQSALEYQKRLDDMGSPLLEQLALARFVERGDLARFLRRVRPIYRERRDTTIAALGELIPDARWRGAAAGLHLHVAFPEGVDERALARAAYERGVLVEDAAWNWADPPNAPPAVVLGYGSVTAPTVRRGIGVLADAYAAVAGPPRG